MNKDNIRLAAFVVIALVQLAIPIKMVLSYNNVLSEGQTYKFQAAPVDPYDPFRGKYVTLSFDAQSWLHPIGEVEIGQTYYLTFREDEKGFAVIKYALLKPPANTDHYLEAKAVHDWDGIIRFEFPFNRFYMEESLAPAAEQAYNSSQWNDSSNTYALVSIGFGKGVIQDVFIDDVPLGEVAAQIEFGK
jgi:hypothetical protein